MIYCSRKKRCISLRIWVEVGWKGATK